MSVRVMSILFAREIRPAARKLIALKLADVANDDGSAIYPSLDTVACHACCSKSTVRRAINGFIDEGFLKLVRKGGKGVGSTNEYAFDMEKLNALPLSKPDEKPAEQEAEKGYQNDTLSKEKGYQNDTLNDVEGYQNDTLEGSQNDTQQRARARGRVPNQPLRVSSGDTQPIPITDIPPKPPQGGASLLFVEFENAWTWQPDERRDQAEHFWNHEMDDDDRRKALDHVPNYFAAFRTGRTRRKSRPMSAGSYLKGKIWMNRKVAVPTFKRQVFTIQETAAFSRAQEHFNISKGFRPDTNYRPRMTSNRPTDGRPFTGWTWKDQVHVFEGDDVPEHILEQENKTWWFVRIEMDEAAE